MAPSTKTIWRVPAYLPYLQPQLTDATLAAAEEQIGHPLPTEYVELLREQNGGYIRYRHDRFLNEVMAGIGPNFPSLTEFSWDEPQEFVSFPLQGLVPFDGDGHWHMCFDYRTSATHPSISYIDVECDSQRAVAPSFAHYLSTLRLKVDDEFVIEGSGDIEAIKSMLTTSLKSKFNPPDVWARGYAIHTARLGDGWINLSPNLVSRGFVRTDDPRYEELRDMLLGQAPRYPEAPPDSIILYTTGQGRTKLLAALGNAGLRVRALKEYVVET